MDDLYQTLISIIGEVPPGMEFIVYIFILFFLLSAFHAFSYMFLSIVQWIGGVK